MLTNQISDWNKPSKSWRLIWKMCPDERLETCEGTSVALHGAWCPQFSNASRRSAAERPESVSLLGFLLENERWRCSLALLSHRAARWLGADTHYKTEWRTTETVQLSPSANWRLMRLKKKNKLDFYPDVDIQAPDLVFSGKAAKPKLIYTR